LTQDEKCRCYALTNLPTSLEEPMKCTTMSIGELRDKYRIHQINLNPPYQRKPVWRTRDRLLLLSSLFNGIPIPAVIFHKYFNSKMRREIYDVLDGKQRIETILHFIKLRMLKGEKELSVQYKNPQTNKNDSLTYSDLSSKKVNKLYENLLEKFLQYEIPVIEYEEDPTDFFGRNVATKEIFVRINSTGSPLKKNEIRHAEKSGPFFELGEQLEKKYEKLFEDWKITSKYEVQRYLLHEFLLELCTAIQHGNYSDRRKKLEELLENHQWKKNELTKLKSTFVQIINWIKEIFPDGTIKVTRFKNKSDFYSLFVVLARLVNNNYITKDKKANKIAGKFLLAFSRQIQNLDLKIRPYSDPKLNKFEENLREYVLSTRQATDRVKERETRDRYLGSALKDGFFLRQKDTTRHFAPIVRDLLWTELISKSKKPKCPNPSKNRNCKRALTYNDAQIDHKYPWSKGGHTRIENAQLLCSSCNSSKGDR
jgi:5-methylcytosine-specific restriction endonuclease McrA